MKSKKFTQTSAKCQQTLLNKLLFVQFLWFLPPWLDMARAAFILCIYIRHLADLPGVNFFIFQLFTVTKVQKMRFLPWIWHQNSKNHSLAMRRSYITDSITDFSTQYNITLLLATYFQTTLYNISGKTILYKREIWVYKADVAWWSGWDSCRWGMWRWYPSKWSAVPPSRVSFMLTSGRNSILNF